MCNFSRKTRTLLHCPEYDRISSSHYIYTHILFFINTLPCWRIYPRLLFLYTHNLKRKNDSCLKDTFQLQILQGTMHNTWTGHSQQNMRLNFLLDATLDEATWSSGQQKLHYGLSLNVHCLWNKMAKNKRVCSVRVQHVNTRLYRVFKKGM